MEQTSMKIFDSHELFENLVHGGFNDKQATVLVKSMVKVNFQDVSHLVTGEQLNNVKTELLNNVNAVKTELQKDIGHIKENMATKAEIATMKFDILKWIIPFMFTNTIAILGVVVAMFFRG